MELPGCAIDKATLRPRPKRSKVPQFGLRGDAPQAPRATGRLRDRAALDLDDKGHARLRTALPIDGDQALRSSLCQMLQNPQLMLAR